MYLYNLTLQKGSAIQVIIRVFKALSFEQSTLVVRLPPILANIGA